MIELVESLGTDATVVNAARVSFDKQIDQLRPKDEKLILYLAQHKHYSPFRHLILQVRVEAPEFVMRQLYKHVVGIEATSSHPTRDHAWNELSMRYTKMNDGAFHVPTIWRKQSEDNKQGSDGVLEDSVQYKATRLYMNALTTMTDTYNALLEAGVAKEQARIILPLSVVTKVFWTVSFQAAMNFILLRDDDHAQKEIRELAVDLRNIVAGLWPVSYKAWIEAHT